MPKIETSPLAMAAAANEKPAVQATIVATPWGSTGDLGIAAPAGVAASVAPIAATLAPAKHELASKLSSLEGGDGKAKVPSLGDKETEADQEISRLSNALAEAEAYLARGKDAKADFDRAFQAAKDRVNELTAALEKIQPPVSVSSVIAAYHASQHKLLATRAEKLAALKSSGIDFKELLKIKSPVDAAMARKTGFGTKRPVQL